MEARTRVAFLGLGAMGGPMCENILAAGFPLTVWNRSPGKAAHLLAKGAVLAVTPRAAAENADVILTCLPMQDEVRDILIRADGLLAGLTPEKTFVDTSTIDPVASQQLIALCAERGVAMIEAPLSGGTRGAQSGTLTMMIGGEAAALERVRPVLASMAKNIFHVGGPGMGQTVKLCNQMIAGAQTIALAEAYAVLHAAGVDAKLATDIFSVSTANCVAIQQRVPVPGVQEAGPASNGWRPGFATEWMAKDLFLLQKFAYALDVPVAQTAANLQCFEQSIQAGYRKLDQSVFGKVLTDRIDAQRAKGD
jgi:3-hydroxyisobutyrate dehydrogenase